MPNPSSAMRNLAGATALALVFAATNSNSAGLVDDSRAFISSAGNLSNLVTKSAGHESARITTGGFMSVLEKTLRDPSETVRIVDFPPRANAEFLRVIAVVPPKGMEQVAIPVCAEQFNKVLGTWTISPKGEVAATAWTGSKISATPTSSACKDFILAARNSLNSMQAGTDPVPPAPPTN